MGKLRYSKEVYDGFVEKTKSSKDKIIEAEIKSFKEIEVSEHFPKIWIITSYSISMCRLSQSTSIQDAISSVISELKYTELRDMNSEMKEIVDDRPSDILGILGVFPSKAIDLRKVIDKDRALAAKLLAKRLNLEDIEGDEQYKEYREYISNTIFTQFDCFYEDTEVNIYKVITHNNEVLDIYLDKEMNNGKGRINGIDKFIDVDRKWTE